MIMYIHKAIRDKAEALQFEYEKVQDMGRFHPLINNEFYPHIFTSIIPHIDKLRTKEKILPELLNIKKQLNEG